MDVPVPYRWLIIALLVTALVVVSTTPARSQVGDSAFEWLVAVTPMPMQKVLHVALYALLSFLIVWAAENADRAMVRYTAAFAGAVILGAALEWAQTRIPGRFGNLTDILLNASGALLGLAAASWLLRRG